MHELSEHAEIMLVASLAALFLGPVIHRVADSEGRVYSLLDGFVVVAVLGLALLEIIPFGVALAGWWALLGMLAGVLLPNLAERRFGGLDTHRAAAWIAMVGMAFHAFTDGLALISTHTHGDSHALEWAVILHRVPVGLAVWWMLTTPDGSGKRAGILALTTIAVTTLAGYIVGNTTSVLEDSALVGMLEAFVGGLLLHVISHGIANQRSRLAAEHRTLTGIGGLAGLGAVIWLFILPALEAGRGRETLDAFWDLLLESAPALLLAYGLAGLIGSAIGEGPIRWLRRAGGERSGAVADAQQAMRGVVFGLPLPLCSCGVVPVYRSLVDRRVPATAALAFLVATPELGLDAVLLSVPLLGVEMAIMRVGVAFVLALLVGAFVGGWAQRQRAHAHVHAHEHDHQQADERSLGARMLDGLRTGYGSILDSTGPWILVGLVLAAFIQPYVDAEFFTSLGPMLQVVAFAIIGLPVYVCATGATPLVAVFIAKGLSPGAALAFLLTGPATNATTFGVLEQLHGRKVALAFTAAMIVSVLGLGWGVNLLWPLLELDGASASGHAHHEGHGLLAQVSAMMLGGLFLVSLVRQGPRGFLGRLWELAGHDHDHDHDHDHHGHDHHGHDHDHAKPAPPKGGSCCH